jgi:hypothetical protein
MKCYVLLERSVELNEVLLSYVELCVLLLCVVVV